MIGVCHIFAAADESAGKSHVGCSYAYAGVFPLTRDTAWFK